MAMSKKSSSKGGLASRMKVSGGPSGKMQKMTPVKPQKAGQSGVSNSGSFSKGKK